MKFSISQQASDDIEDIWVYTFHNRSPEQADRYVNLLFDEIEYVAKNPGSGKDLTQIRDGYRCSKVKSHLIFYRSSALNKEVETIRILHERMDIENRLSDT